MLAALLENNNNARVQPQPSTIRIDRGGGGPSWPSYEIVDIIAATAAFPEIAGEDSVVRAVRRNRWIGEALPFVKEAREKREAVAFMAGAKLADNAVREEFAAAEKLSIDQLIQIIDDVRRANAPMAVPTPASAQSHRVRGEANDGINFGGAAIAVGLLLGGVLIGSALSNARRRRRA
jgi:hypothetical protein